MRGCESIRGGTFFTGEHLLGVGGFAWRSGFRTEVCAYFIGEIEDMHIPQHMKGYKFQVHCCELYRHDF